MTLTFDSRRARRLVATPLAAFALTAAWTIPDALAQQGTLAARIAAAPDGQVQFNFPARDGVCGNGRSYLSWAPGSFSGSFFGSVDETLRSDPCVAGPVRVLVTRAGTQVVSIQSFAGPLQPTPGATDLGAVTARDAAAYLLGVAARGEGSPSREAILPAMLAEGADNWAPLLAIARDQNRPLETRQSAIAWLGRGAGDSQASPATISNALLEIARDRNERQPVRSRALSAVARQPQGAGIPTMMSIARAGDDAWMSREATTALASSGDPRARTFLRELVESPSATSEVRRAALRGIGRSSHATGEDQEFLRAYYRRATDDAARDEVLRLVGALGGQQNQSWLLGIARDESEPADRRRRALQAVARNDGVAVPALVDIYDRTTDRRVRQELITLLARRTEPAATDKLLAIARSETDRTLQRAAINRLSQSNEPRVREALQAIVTRP